MTDNVNQPSHYTTGSIEVIEAIEAWHLNFYRANVVKYVARAGKKDPNKELEDLKKAQWYLNREIQKMEEKISSQLICYKCLKLISLTDTLAINHNGQYVCGKCA